MTKLDEYQQRLVEIIQEHPESIDKIALDNIAENFAEGIRKDPTQLPLSYCRSFGARGFVAFARLAFPKFNNTGLYFSVQRINRHYNQKTWDKIKKLIEFYDKHYPKKETRSNYIKGLHSPNFSREHGIPFPYLDLRLWAGVPKHLQSGESHCDWGCNNNGLIQAPEVKDEDLEKIVIPSLGLQQIKSNTGFSYYCPISKKTEATYNEYMRLYKVLSVNQ